MRSVGYESLASTIWRTRLNPRPARPEESAMFVISTIGRLAADYAAARNRRRTEQQIRSLPLEIQKDIGWPDLQPRRSASPSTFGAWAGCK